MPRQSASHSSFICAVTLQTSKHQPPRALSETEKDEVLMALNSERFADEPPRQVYATLLDQDRYLCHWRTMYRILAQKGQVCERRNQPKHPVYEKPEILATAPLQLWSWDISKMRGPQKWSYYYLYVLLDVFSLYVVGWMVTTAERALLAREFIESTCKRQDINRDQLTIHADRGSPMISKTVGQLLVDLGVEKAHSRPHVSNDNPYSEAQFKTMKYRPDYPKQFAASLLLKPGGTSTVMVRDARRPRSNGLAW
ncbi:MAG: putative transposase [Rhodothermales bacterium]|jgi:putative transposase